MTYDEALDFIYSRRKFQKSSGHQRIRRLLELVDNPQNKLRFIHVVGTNAKGSVCTALSCILKSAGYTVGLFTSPFVLEFGERIRVNGEFIPKSAVASIVSMLKEKIEIMEKEELYPTVFEVTTVLAMVYFSDMNCDAVVLEAGIGGKNDSTNVIGTPCLAVITSVSLDHTEMLGGTVAEITKEKCGIIKNGCPVVSYPFENCGLPFKAQNSDAAKVIKKECLEKGSTLYLPDAEAVSLIQSDLNGTQMMYKQLCLKSSMCGKFQIANIITAVTAAEVLAERSFLIDKRAIENGISEFFIPGRLECVNNEPTVILDAGHNEDAIKQLVKELSAFKKGRHLTALCAFMKDKDYNSAIESLAPLCDKMIFTRVDFQRGEDPLLLAEKAKRFCKSCDADNDTENAFRLALKMTENNGILLVCGSFYLVSEIRKIYFPD